MSSLSSISQQTVVNFKKFLSLYWGNTRNILFLTWFCRIKIWSNQNILCQCWKLFFICRWTVGSDNTTYEGTDWFLRHLGFSKSRKESFSSLIIDGKNLNERLEKRINHINTVSCLLHSGSTSSTQRWSTKFSYQFLKVSSWWSWQNLGHGLYLILWVLFIKKFSKKY